jgi:hypothetical protein
MEESNYVLYLRICTKYLMLYSVTVVPFLPSYLEKNNVKIILVCTVQSDQQKIAKNFRQRV